MSNLDLKDSGGTTFQEAYTLSSFQGWDGYGAVASRKEDVECAAKFWVHTNGEFDAYSKFTATSEGIFVIALYDMRIKPFVLGDAKVHTCCFGDIEFHNGSIELFTIEGTTGDHVVFSKDTVANEPHVIIERIRKLVCETIQ